MSQLQKEINNERMFLLLFSSAMIFVLYGLAVSSMLMVGSGVGVMLLCTALLPEFEGKATPISNKIVNWNWSK